MFRGNSQGHWDDVPSHGNAIRTRLSRELSFGITLTFPNGTIVTIKKGSAKSVMHLMKLYERRICYVWTKRKYPVLRLPAICPNEHGHKWPVPDCEDGDGTSATRWCRLHLLLKEPPAGKMLKWDGDGFLLYQKRLERGTFELPFFDPQSKQCKMLYKTLSAIMSGICLKVWDIENGLICRCVRLRLIGCISVR